MTYPGSLSYSVCVRLPTSINKGKVRECDAHEYTQMRFLLVPSLFCMEIVIVSVTPYGIHS